MREFIKKYSFVGFVFSLFIIVYMLFFNRYVYRPITTKELINNINPINAFNKQAREELTVIPTEFTDSINIGVSAGTATIKDLSISWQGDHTFKIYYTYSWTCRALFWNYSQDWTTKSTFVVLDQKTTSFKTEFSQNVEHATNASFEMVIECKNFTSTLTLSAPEDGGSTKYNFSQYYNFPSHVNFSIEK